MKLYKITDQQIHDVVMHALITAFPDATGKDWDVLIGAVLAGVATLDRENNLAWNKEFNDLNRVSDAAWKLVPMIREATHEAIMAKLHTLIEEAGRV